MARILLTPLAEGVFRRNLNSTWLFTLFAVALLAGFLPPRSSAQGRVVRMEKKLRPVPLPTVEVMRIVGLTRKSEAITRIPTDLEIGDVLVGTTGAVTVRVHCNSSADFVLKGPFKYQFLRPKKNGECNLRDLGKKGAQILVNSHSPTEIQSGAARLGSSRTWYEVRSPARGTLLRLLGGLFDFPEILVYEDEVIVRSRFFSGAIREGQKLVTESECRPVIKKLEPKDYRRAAEAYARLDVSEIPDEKDLEAAFRQLVSLHQAVLENPRNQENVSALNKARAKLGIPVSEPSPP